MVWFHCQPAASDKLKRNEDATSDMAAWQHGNGGLALDSHVAPLRALVAIEAIAGPNLVRSAVSPCENKLVKRFPIAIAL